MCEAYLVIRSVGKVIRCGTGLPRRMLSAISTACLPPVG